MLESFAFATWLGSKLFKNAGKKKFARMQAEAHKRYLQQQETEKQEKLQKWNNWVLEGKISKERFEELKRMSIHKSIYNM